MESETKAKSDYKGYGYHGGGRKATGVKRISFSVSCQPEEFEKLKILAQKSGKSTSRFLLDLAFSNTEESLNKLDKTALMPS